MRTGATNETDAKKKAQGTLRTYQESVSKALRQSGQGLHQEGARDGISEQHLLGLKQRNIRETGVGTPEREEHWRESPELSKNRGRSEDHQ